MIHPDHEPTVVEESFQNPHWNREAIAHFTSGAFLWMISFHLSFPPQKERHRIFFLAKKTQKLVVFFWFNLPQPTRPWTFWSSTWIDSNKASWKNPWGSGCFQPSHQPAMVQLVITAPNGFHPSTCDVSPEAKHEFACFFFIFMLRRGTHNITTVLGVGNPYIFPSKFFCASAVRCFLWGHFPCKNDPKKFRAPKPTCSFRVFFP